MEYKRRKILEEQEAMKERNTDVKQILNVYQCHVRSRSIMDRIERDTTMEMLLKMKKNDPLDSEQRKRLCTGIKALNTEFSIGARLERPARVTSCESVPNSP